MSQNQNTYSNSFKLDGSRVSKSVVGDNNIRELRYVVPAVALSGNEEIAALVLGEPLKPIDEKGVGIPGGPLVSRVVVIRSGVGV